jgi:hypothetical protein
MHISVSPIMSTGYAFKITMGWEPLIWLTETMKQELITECRYFRTLFEDEPMLRELELLSDCSLTRSDVRSFISVALNPWEGIFYHYDTLECFKSFCKAANYFGHEDESPLLKYGLLPFSRLATVKSVDHTNVSELLLFYWSYPGKVAFEKFVNQLCFHNKDLLSCDCCVMKVVKSTTGMLPRFISAMHTGMNKRIDDITDSNRSVVDNLTESWTRMSFKSVTLSVENRVLLAELQPYRDAEAQKQVCTNRRASLRPRKRTLVDKSELE